MVSPRLSVGIRNRDLDGYFFSGLGFYVFLNLP